MSDVRDPATDQPLPRPGHLPVQDILVNALLARRVHGIRKYGRPLETDNGRNPLLDLWEELLDGLSYLTQALLEQGHEFGELPGAAFLPLRQGTMDALQLAVNGPRGVPCRACRAPKGLSCDSRMLHRERVAEHRDQMVRTLRAALGMPIAAPTSARPPGPAASPVPGTSTAPTPPAA